MNLGLGDEIGTLDAGKWADIVVLDPGCDAGVARTARPCPAIWKAPCSPLMMLGDDRAVRATYVAGRLVKGCSPGTLNS